MGQLILASKDKLRLSLINNKVLWVIVTIFLGAIGSGLWDLAFKPSFAFLSDSMVEISIRFFDSFQRSIFIKIAALGRELTGRTLLSMFMGVFGGISLILVISYFTKSKFIKSKPNSPRGAEGKLPITFIFVLSAIFIQVFTIFVAGKHSYIIQKQNNYLQMNRIIAPYISQADKLKIESKFSLVITLKDYEKIMNEMRLVAIANDINLPPQLKHLTSH